jgi:hypothetical protein
VYFIPAFARRGPHLFGRPCLGFAAAGAAPELAEFDCARMFVFRWFHWSGTDYIHKRLRMTSACLLVFAPRSALF